MAVLRQGRCGTPDRRPRTGLCGPRRRQRPQAKRATSKLPGGRKRQCVHWRVSLVGGRRQVEGFCSRQLPTVRAQTRIGRETSMTTSIAPLTKRAAWKALEAHYTKVRALHLRRAFADDPK